MRSKGKDDRNNKNKSLSKNYHSGKSLPWTLQKIPEDGPDRHADKEVKRRQGIVTDIS